MKFLTSKWSKLFVLSALLVLTTGIAAAPMRSVLLPLATRQLQLWGFSSKSVALPTAVPAAPRSELTQLDGGTLTALGDPAGYLGGTGAVAGSSDREEAKATAKDSGSDAREARTRPGSRNISDSRFGRNGRFSGRAIGSGGSGGGGIGGIVPGGNGGASGASNASGASGGAEPGTNQPAAGGLFSEHTAGLPELTGAPTEKTGGSSAALASAGTNVAANPEPSTFLLLATGLAAGARAVRRRLRSR